MAGPDWSFEQEALQAGHGYIAGVDEAGRGPLAGPVVTAAVILPFEREIQGIRDSKKLSHGQRLKARERILDQALAYSWGAASPTEIDRLNIHQATLLAMRRAVTGLRPGPDFLLVDGRFTIAPHPGYGQRAVIKGDDRSFSIAAASILAKVMRDEIMFRLARAFPGYGLDRNKGYPTKDHREALARLGPCPAHRRSFAPVKQIQGSLFP